MWKSAPYACRSQEHLTRRGFLAGASAGALGMVGFQGMTRAEGTQALAAAQKHVVVFFLAGGVSQLETWDPKPGTATGGPFQAIQTSAPGVQICELLPHTAQIMHHLALVRGINTAEGDHAKGHYIMETGHPQRQGFEYPSLGATMAYHLSPPDLALPGHLLLNSGSPFPQEAAFLGPKFAGISLPASGEPAYLKRPDSITDTQDAQRRALRLAMSQRFAQGRRGSEIEAFNESHKQAANILAKKDVFDFSRMPTTDEDRYGKHDFAKHCRMALRLIEQGVPFVKVSHSNYDTHSENFNFHIEQLGEFDRPFATFVGDLAERGLLEHTLVIVMSEFGRTPRINHLVGRDHWGTAWSIALGGAGIKGGAVSGKTNDDGTKVIDREVNGGHLFHTYYRAVGLDSSKSFYNNGQPIDKADSKTEPLTEILA